MRLSDVKNIIAGRGCLQRLPSIRLPIGRYREERDVLIVYTFFHWPEEDLQYNFSEHFVKGAVWSRNSLLLNSDVMERGATIRFLVPDYAYVQFVGACHDNYIPTNTVVSYSPSALDELRYSGEYRRGFGARILSLYDDRFSEYKYIWMMDHDCFLAKSTRLPADVKFPLVDRILSAPEDRVGVGRINLVTLKDAPDFGKILGRRFYKEDQRLFRKRTREWLGRPIRQWEVLYGSYCPSVLYPRELLSGKFGKWFFKGMQAIQDDESVLALCEVGRFKPPYSFAEEWELETVQACERVYDLEEVDFYLSHFSSGWEHLWRKHIGAWNYE